MTALLVLIAAIPFVGMVIVIAVAILERRASARQALEDEAESNEMIEKWARRTREITLARQGQSQISRERRRVDQIQAIGESEDS